MEVLSEKKSSLATIMSQNVSLEIKQEVQNKDKALKNGIDQAKIKVLEISVPRGDKFYLETLKKELKFLENLASEVLEEKVKVRLSEKSEGRISPREREVEVALKDPSVRYFMDLFKARVISVEQVNRTKTKG